MVGTEGIAIEVSRRVVAANLKPLFGRVVVRLAKALEFAIPKEVEIAFVRDGVVSDVRSRDVATSETEPA
jgi:hypothetical protein